MSTPSNADAIRGAAERAAAAFQAKIEWSFEDGYAWILCYEGEANFRAADAVCQAISDATGRRAYLNQADAESVEMVLDADLKDSSAPPYSGYMGEHIAEYGQPYEPAGGVSDTPPPAAPPEAPDRAASILSSLSKSGIRLSEADLEDLARLFRRHAILQALEADGIRLTEADLPTLEEALRDASGFA